MQVPEKLTLIGGGILLSSLLVFTLKSQVSNLLPKISGPISSIYDHAGDAQNGSFASDFKDAQRKGWQTGQWGSAKFYIDDNHNMYVGSGDLQGSLYNSLGNDAAHSLKHLVIQGNVRAPQDSSYLFSAAKDRYADDNHSLTMIEGMDHVDTSQVQDMTSIFANDYSLNHLDLSSWNTGNLQNLYTAFNNTTSLTDLKGLNDWNTQKVWNTSWTFYNNPIAQLDLSNWHMRLRDASDMFNKSSLQSVDMSNIDDSNADSSGMFAFTPNIQQIKLGNEGQLSDSNLRDSNWKNGNDSLNTDGLIDGNSHPGTWGNY